MKRAPASDRDAGWCGTPRFGSPASLVKGAISIVLAHGSKHGGLLRLAWG